MEQYQPGIGIAAGSLMLKYEMIGEHVPPVNPGQRVNVFINLESVIYNLTTSRNLNTSAMFHKQKVVIELEAAILNLVAHYRTYFRRYQADVCVYLYYTDLKATDQQTMKTYNQFYRSTYHAHYCKNPDYKVIGDLITKHIVPEVGIILTYVPTCKLITSKRFDSSLIPALVAEINPADVNVIFTADVFDTLYFFREKFWVVQIKRRYSHFNVISNVDDSVRSIVPGESVFDLGLLTSDLYYKLLLSIKGSKVRNIRSAKGFGYQKFLAILREGKDRGIILKDFHSLSSILELFPEKYRDDIGMGYRCSDIETQLSLLGPSDRDFVRSQMVDKSDIESLEALNNKRFLEFPINLPGLLNGG